MQAQDIVEMMESRRCPRCAPAAAPTAIRLLEEALAEAEQNAKLVADRVRRQLERATAVPPLAAQRA